jgi:hypothetical protein
VTLHLAQINRFNLSYPTFLISRSRTSYLNLGAEWNIETNIWNFKEKEESNHYTLDTRWKIMGRFMITTRRHFSSESLGPERRSLYKTNSTPLPQPGCNLIIGRGSMYFDVQWLLSKIGQNWSGRPSLEQAFDSNEVQGAPSPPIDNDNAERNARCE